MIIFNTTFAPSDGGVVGFIKYALIVLVITLMVIGFLILLGPQLSSAYSSVTKGIGNPDGWERYPAMDSMCAAPQVYFRKVINATSYYYSCK